MIPSSKNILQQWQSIIYFPSWQQMLRLPISPFISNTLAIRSRMKQLCAKYVVLCSIWYHLYNSKNKKSTHGGVLLFVKLLQLFSLQPSTLLKIKLLHGCFPHFLNYTNGTKSRKASPIFIQPTGLRVLRHQ